MSGQDYKGIWIRFAAQIIDGILPVIVSAPLLYLTLTSFWLTEIIPGLDPMYLIAAAYFASIQFVYFLVLEGLTGTTIGKRIFKMKVTKEDGSKCGVGPSFVRNILRLVDGVPYLVPYVLGAYFVSKSTKRQRLGDRVAHTVVVSRSSAKS